MKKLLVIPNYNIQTRNFIEYECGINFADTMIIEPQVDYKDIIKKITSYDEAYFTNFTDEYRKILPFIPFKTKCYSIMTNEIGEYTNNGVLSIFNSVIEFYDRLIFKKIYALSYELVMVLKNSGYNAEQLKFSLNTKFVLNNKKTEGIVGIICDDFNPNNNFYNILTALSMTKVKRIKLISNMPATIEFIERFNLPVEYCNDIYDVIDNSSVNVLINFTANKFNLLNESLKLGIPCLIGNFDSDFIKKYDKNLIINSDDDVNEISNKINNLL